MKKVLLFALPIMLATSAKAQDCPNGDFENWASHAYSNPDSSWYTSNIQSLAKADTLTVWPVTGHAGQAIHIQTAIVGMDTLQAYAINTLGDPKNGSGGVPYSQQPTSITGYYRYNMVSNDSAIMIIEFKKAGTVISVTEFAYRNVSGSMPTFTAFSFPLSSIPVAPDSVIIGLTSSNVNGPGLQSGSWVEIDQLAFGGTGITQPIPGGSFDTWNAQSVDVPNGWTIGSHGNGGSGVTKSTTHYGGSYSLQLTTQPGGGGGGGSTVLSGAVTTGIYSPNNGPVGGLPYTHTTDTLTGYYMYAPVGADTAMVGVTLTAAGSIVGGTNYNIRTASSSWTYFEMPFSAGSTPDTMRIDIQSGSWYAAQPGSVLNIDHLQLKSQPLPPVSTGMLSGGSHAVTAYPNPANDVLNIRYDYNITGPVSAKIYDMMGRVIDSRSYNTPTSIVTFQVGYLPAGLYFYEVMNNGNVIRDKFLKD